MTTKEFYELLLKYPDANIVIFLTNTLYKGVKYFSADLTENVKNGKLSSSIKINILDKKPKRNATYRYFLRFLRKFKKQDKPLIFTHKYLETIIYEPLYNENNNTLYLSLEGQPIQKNIVVPTGEIVDVIKKLPEKDRNMIYNHGYFPTFLRVCGYKRGSSTNSELKQFFTSQAEKDVQKILRLAKRDDFLFRLTHFL